MKKPSSMTLSRMMASLLLMSFLGACNVGSYDDAVADFNSNISTPPPPPPPPPGGFGPNFSEIQASVFTPTCATAGCHSGANPPLGLNLEVANSYAMLVGVPSGQDTAIQRVNPGNPDNSYLIHKLEGSAATGQQMPPTGGPLAQAEIDVIRQWISAGAIDDTVQASTPIRISSMSPMPNESLTAAPAQITAGFDREVDASTVNANTFLLEASGNDGSFADGNEVTITAASISVPAANTQSAVFDLTGVALADDTYRIRLLGSGASIILDLDANALDGEFSGVFPSGNNAAGGDFDSRFTIVTPIVLGPTLDQIQAVIFTPSCASAGCHSGLAPAASMSLANADTSLAALLGIASSQQAGAVRVIAGDPANSYLIQKLENAAGIAGSQMPIGRNPLAQADIDEIRTWISNGALR